MAGSLAATSQAPAPRFIWPDPRYSSRLRVPSCLSLPAGKSCSQVSVGHLPSAELIEIAGSEPISIKNRPGLETSDRDESEIDDLQRSE